MTARTYQPTNQAAQARTITASSVVTNLIVRAAGLVPARLDLSHVGTPEQQLGLTLGGVLIYMNSRESHQTGEKPAGRLISGGVD